MQARFRMCAAQRKVLRMRADARDVLKLHERIIELKEQLLEQSESETLGRRIAELEIELERKTRELEALKVDKQSQALMVGGLKSSLVEALAENASLSTSVATLVRTSDQAHAKVESSDAVVAQLQMQVEESREVEAELSETVVNLEQRVAGLQMERDAASFVSSADLEKVKRLLQESKNTQKETFKELEFNGTRERRTEASLSAAKKELTALRVEFAELQGITLGAKEGSEELALLKTTCADLRSEMRSLRNCNDWPAREKRLQEELARANATIAKLSLDQEIVEVSDARTGLEVDSRKKMIAQQQELIIEDLKTELRRARMDAIEADMELEKALMQTKPPCPRKPRKPPKPALVQARSRQTFWDRVGAYFDNN